ncbi:MAG: hypothetical protein BGO65_10475 [Afipia sp. 64-13]|nr:MAG: hypothetical protein BGO65_10475 [Afipia sp. 64-13]
MMSDMAASWPAPLPGSFGIDNLHIAIEATSLTFPIGIDYLKGPIAPDRRTMHRVGPGGRARTVGLIFDVTDRPYQTRTRG